MATNEQVVKFGRWECVPAFGQYGNGCTAIQLLDAADGSLVTVASVNLADGEVRDGEIAVKNWTENEGMVEALVSAGLIEPPHRYVPSGFVEVPICRLAAPAPTTEAPDGDD